MRRLAAWQRKKEPARFVSITVVQSSGVSRAIRPSRVTPGVADEHVEIAERLLARSDELTRRIGVRDVGLQRRGPAAGRVISATTSAAASASAR